MDFELNEQFKKNMRPVKDDYYDDFDDEWLTYDERKRGVSLNAERGVFADKNEETSINTAKSVFDRTAVFDTTSRLNSRSGYASAPVKELTGYDENRTRSRK
ncbi:MAG: hypothetical protein IJ805_05545 [Lachnospiraceae bacterium]|nr:hypothetical protein [Lachnospiraceae bacterium]